MKNPKRFTVRYRRKREGKTDYKKRLKVLLANKPRLVVRKSLRGVSAQLIQFSPQGDKVLACATSRHLSKYEWKVQSFNSATAYLVGLLIGVKAKKIGVEKAILDIGLQSSRKGSNIYAVLKGALDAGLAIPHSDDILPSEERVSGAHIAAYAKTLKENKEAYTKQYNLYLKQQLDPEQILSYVDTTKKKILEA